MFRSWCTDGAGTFLTPETLAVLQTTAVCHPQVKIEKEKVYIRASKQVRG